MNQPALEETPARTAPTPAGVTRSPAGAEADPAAIRAWIAGLPREDPDAAIAALVERVRRAHRLELGAPERLQVLALYRAAVLALADHPFPPPEPGPRARALAALLLEVESGYSRVVREALAEARRAGPWRERDPWPGAVFAALELAGESLLRTSRARVPPVAGIFRKMHMLYRVAESRASLTLPVPPRLARRLEGGKRATIERLYKAHMLFHCTDPFGSPPASLPPVLAACYRYAGAARLTTDPSRTAGPVAMVELASDGPPASAFRPLAGAEGDPAAFERRYLDATRVVQVLERELSGAPRPEDAPPVPAGTAPLLRRLRRRRDQEAGAGGGRETPVRAALGLAALHHFLRDGATRLREALEDPDDVMQIDLSQIDLANAEAKAEAVVAHRLETWRLRQAGPEDYRLHRPGPGEEAVAAGDLLGIVCNPGGLAPGLDLALVRWARRDDRERLYLSVEPLPGDVIAAVCTNGSSRRHGDTPVPCLQVTPERRPGATALLLAPADTAWEHTQVVLEIEGKTRLVKVGPRSEGNDRVACYELPGRSRR